MNGPGRLAFRFWQEGPGYDRNLFSAQAIEASVVYIHMNPVRRGLRHQATDWKWRSARYHLLGQQELDLPKLRSIDPSWLHRTANQYYLG